MAIRSLKQFKEEFRLICGDGDEWGTAMEAWFECAGRMTVMRMKLPMDWQYKPPTFGSPSDKESYWFPFFYQSRAKTLRQIGDFLFRYCLYLKFKGKSY